MKKNKLNSKNPKYKSGRGYSDKEDESEKQKQTKILNNLELLVQTTRTLSMVDTFINLYWSQKNLIAFLFVMLHLEVRKFIKNL